MQFTLYDYLILYQYKIIEAIKNGFPEKSDYNQWIYREVLSQIIEYKWLEDPNELNSSGVYSLDSFYIGKSSKPIILRIINHLFETIPTLKTDVTMQNLDKIKCIKYKLLLNIKLDVRLLSEFVEDEQKLIESEDDESCDYILMNRQYVRNRKIYIDYFKHELSVDGFCQRYGTPDDFKYRLRALKERGFREDAKTLLNAYSEGYKMGLKS